MTKVRLIFLWLGFTAGIAGTRGAGPPAVPLTRADFETGDLTQLKRQQAADDSITLVKNPVRAGSFAARILLRATDAKVSNGQRAEFSDRNTPVGMDRDYWYGLSILVPDEFMVPEKSDAVLFQWHTQQGGPSPVLAIRVQRGEWLITTSAMKKRRTLKSMALEKGRWTDWVVHVRWAAAPTGFWRIWKDGVEVVNETGVVTQYPEALGPYAKFGQYHSVEEAARNVIFVDEYRVADGGGSFESVSPAQRDGKQ